MINFFHKLFNPHCPDCVEDKRCQNCDTLRSLLESERFNNKQLLNAILEQHKPLEQEIRNETPMEIPNKALPWRIRQQMLEAEDRAKNKLIKERQSIEELEKELGVTDNAS